MTNNENQKPKVNGVKSFYSWFRANLYTTPTDKSVMQWQASRLFYYYLIGDENGRLKYLDSKDDDKIIVARSQLSSFLEHIEDKESLLGMFSGLRLPHIAFLCDQLFDYAATQLFLQELKNDMEGRRSFHLGSIARLVHGAGYQLIETLIFDDYDSTPCDQKLIDLDMHQKFLAFRIEQYSNRLREASLVHPVLYLTLMTEFIKTMQVEMDGVRAMTKNEYGVNTAGKRVHLSKRQDDAIAAWAMRQKHSDHSEATERYYPLAEIGRRLGLLDKNRELDRYVGDLIGVFENKLSWTNAFFTSSYSESESMDRILRLKGFDADSLIESSKQTSPKACLKLSVNTNLLKQLGG